MLSKGPLRHSCGKLTPTFKNNVTESGVERMSTMNSDSVAYDEHKLRRKASPGELLP